MVGLGWGWVELGWVGWVGLVGLGWGWVELGWVGLSWVGVRVGVGLSWGLSWVGVGLGWGWVGLCCLG